MAKKPSEAFLEKVKKEVQSRLTESSKFVKGKQEKWDESERLYNNEVVQRERSYESNLLVPKPHYVIETITPQHPVWHGTLAYP